MTRYVFIQSRDPFEAREPHFLEETAIAVKERGHEVIVILVQNGVLAARQSTGRLERLTKAGVTVLADNLSLRERGISSEELAPSVQESGIGALVDVLVQEKTKAIWH